MSKKMAFLNTDKKWYWAVYTSKGDFSKLIGPFESLEEANRDQGVPETTPAGEYIESDEVVVSQDEAKGVDTDVDAGVTPELVEKTKEELEATPTGTIVEAPETAPVAPEQTAPATGLESVPQGTDNGPVNPETVTAPVAPESTPVAPVTHEVTPTLEVTPEAPVAPVENTPVAPETAPVAPTDTPVEGESTPVAPVTDNNVQA